MESKVTEGLLKARTKKTINIVRTRISKNWYSFTLLIRWFSIIFKNFVELKGINRAFFLLKKCKIKGIAAAARAGKINPFKKLII